jgi:hypothetical protein
MGRQPNVQHRKFDRGAHRGSEVIRRLEQVDTPQVKASQHLECAEVKGDRGWAQNKIHLRLMRNIQNRGISRPKGPP